MLCLTLDNKETKLNNQTKYIERRPKIKNKNKNKGRTFPKFRGNGKPNRIDSWKLKYA